MINFKYQVEVIVDLGGKLASLLQSSQSKGGPGPASVVVNPYEAGSGIASWNTSIVDTQQLRRQKGVISVVFEVVVGTVDSNRQRGRGWSRPEPYTHTQQLDASQVHPEDRKGGRSNESEDDAHGHEEEGPYPYPDEQPALFDDSDMRRPSYSRTAPPQHTAPFYVPPAGAPGRRRPHREGADKESRAEAATKPASISSSHRSPFELARA